MMTPDEIRERVDSLAHVIGALLSDYAEGLITAPELETKLKEIINKC